jgi:hypothetical protein
MLLHRVATDQNVIYVYDNKVIIPLLENVLHESAKCVGCIGESKRHDQKLIRVIPCVTNDPFAIQIW